MGTPLLRYLTSLCDDPQMAEEILQDTFVAIWRAAPSFEGRSTARTWCFGIARRRAHDTLRTLQRGSRQDVSLDETSETPSPLQGPEDAALDRVELGRLTEGIRQLSAIHREVLVLAFVEGWNGQEIATVLEVPAGTVKSRLSNARRALRRLVHPEEAP